MVYLEIVETLGFCFMECKSNENRAFRSGTAVSTFARTNLSSIPIPAPASTSWQTCIIILPKYQRWQSGTKPIALWLLGRIPYSRDHAVHIIMIGITTGDQSPSQAVTFQKMEPSIKLQSDTTTRSIMTVKITGKEVPSQERNICGNGFEAMCVTHSCVTESVQY